MKKFFGLSLCFSLFLTSIAHSEEFRIQVTAINFGAGTTDASVKNRVITLDTEDKNKEVIVSENDYARLGISSHMGSISLFAKDPKTGENLGTVIGAFNAMSGKFIQFGPYNARGFSFMNVREVTAKTPEELDFENKANDVLTRKLADELLKDAQKNETAPKN
jgi:hypothetical protein